MKNLALIAILFIAIIGCKQTESTKPVENTAAVPIATATPDTSITLAKFNQLKTGMTYKEAVQILGSEGEVLSESDIGGTKTVMYQWQSSGFGNMNAMFQNNKMVSKSQFGLK